MRPIPSNEGELLVIWWLKIYYVSVAILLSAFYLRVRVKAGPISRDSDHDSNSYTPGAYVIMTGLIKKGR